MPREVEMISTISKGSCSSALEYQGFPLTGAVRWIQCDDCKFFSPITKFNAITGGLLFFYHVTLFTVGVGTIILGSISLGKLP